MTEYSMFLFARPSFVEGCARLVDLAGTLNEYNYAPDGAQADRLGSVVDTAALAGDFAVAREHLLVETKNAKR